MYILYERVYLSRQDSAAAHQVCSQKTFSSLVFFLFFFQKYTNKRASYVLNANISFLHGDERQRKTNFFQLTFLTLFRQPPKNVFQRTPIRVIIMATTVKCFPSHVLKNIVQVSVCELFF